MHGQKNIKNMGKMSLTPLSKVWLLLHRFSENLQLHNIIILRYSIPNFTKICQYIRKGWVESRYAGKQSVTVTELIVTKFALVRRIFVKNSNAEFHSNPTNDVFSRTKLQADVPTDRMMDVVST